jgi:5-(carboxyamino)imidazole ribonucleotide synthase
MMIPRAIELGIELRVLAEGDGMSAQLAATAVGDYMDANTVLAFARDVDVITFDHEHVPQDVLAQLAEAGIAVHPGPAPLAVAQDKILMRQELTRLGLPVPEWASVSTPAALDEFLVANGGRVIVKTPRGGYDGKGVRVVTASSDVADWFEAGNPLLAEELVSFTRELAQLAARNPSGEVALWPLVESIQQDGVCAEVIAPAPALIGSLADAAAIIARTVADELGVTGVLAVELFETFDGRLLINELAMRPHNSGHWTMDGAVTSQFEQHLRAVLDLPLGATDARSPWTVMINVLGGPASGTIADRYPAAFANQPTAKFHEYGKAPRPGRKVGHVNVSGDDLEDVVYRARAAAAILKD